MAWASDLEQSIYNSGRPQRDPVQYWWVKSRLKFKQVAAYVLLRSGVKCAVIILCMQNSALYAADIFENKNRTLALIQAWAAQHEHIPPLNAILANREDPVAVEAIVWAAYFKLYCKIAEWESKGCGATAQELMEEFKRCCGGDAAPEGVKAYIDRNEGTKNRKDRFVRKLRKKWHLVFRQEPVRNVASDEEIREKVLGGPNPISGEPAGCISGTGLETNSETIFWSKRVYENGCQIWCTFSGPRNKFSKAGPRTETHFWGSKSSYVFVPPKSPRGSFQNPPRGAIPRGFF